MEFPLPTVRVGDCLAIAYSIHRERGEGRCKDKYNRVKYDGEFWPAHRLSYHLNKEPIPKAPPSRKEGLALHSCDHKWCIDPEHIYIGTASQNSKDNAERNEGWRKKRSEVAKAQMSDPEQRRKQSEARKAKWRDPEYRNKCIASHKKFAEENPEYMNSKAKRMREVRREISRV